MDEVKVSQQDSIDILEALGEFDMSNVDVLNKAIKAALSDDTTSCLLDLSGLAFLDSSVIHSLVRWSQDVQLSQREALAISVGEGTSAARLVALVGLNGRLPIFASREAAKTALLEGQRTRGKRSLEWLTDAELHAARTDAQATSDAAERRLEDITAEEHRRSDEPR
jgi:anti-anti-sigma factor